MCPLPSSQEEVEEGLSTQITEASITSFSCSSWPALHTHLFLTVPLPVLHLTGVLAMGGMPQQGLPFSIPLQPQQLHAAAGGFPHTFPPSCTSLPITAWHTVQSPHPAGFTGMYNGSQAGLTPQTFADPLGNALDSPAPAPIRVFPKRAGFTFVNASGKHSIE